ncbi:sulfur carrier protein ThiS [Streptomyces sp. MST-110588]|nr:sulfur carrier protein ThiS [Streptomyces sp. MST-110588]
MTTTPPATPGPAPAPASASAPGPATGPVPASEPVPAPVSVSVSVNGRSRRIPDGLTLDRLVATLTQAPTGVAAALNETVVPRGQWPATPLGEGDRVEVLTAVQGG